MSADGRQRRGPQKAGPTERRDGSAESDARRPSGPGGSGPDDEASAGRGADRGAGGQPGPRSGWPQGPLTLRRGTRPGSITDQRLLDSRGPVDWVHTDPWRVLRIQSEFVEGFGTLAELGPAVSVFGSARTKVDSDEYRMAEQLAAALVRAGYAVITGGGPGVMEAANKGASQAGGTAVGLGIELPFEHGLNEWVDLGINFRYFFVRKTMFVKYARAFCVLPGGFGTMDELFEALTLVQTKRVTRFPVVLLGSWYWQGLLDWLRDTMLPAGNLNPADLDLMCLTDDIDEAVAHVLDADKVLAERQIVAERSAGEPPVEG